MSLPPLRIGLIGCGRAAEHLYLPAFSRLHEVDLVAAADLLPERRELVASAVRGCEVFSSVEQLLEKSRVEAVIVATPPKTHVALAALALGKEISVLIEKPLALSLADVEPLQRLDRVSRDRVMLGMNRRHWKPVLQLKRAIDSRGLTTACFRLNMSSAVDEWLAISGAADPLDDLGTHQLDLLRFLASSELAAVRATRPDASSITVHVRLANGFEARCDAAQSDVSRESVQVDCPAARYEIHVGSERIRPLHRPLRSLLDAYDSVRRRLNRGKSSFRQSYDRQLACFARCVRLGGRMRPGLADGVAALCAVEAARESAERNGEEIMIA